jgi:cytochrome c556
MDFWHKLLKGFANMDQFRALSTKFIGEVQRTYANFKKQEKEIQEKLDLHR